MSETTTKYTVVCSCGFESVFLQPPTIVQCPKCKLVLDAQSGIVLSNPTVDKELEEVIDQLVGETYGEAEPMVPLSKYQELEAKLERLELFYERALQEAARNYIQDCGQPMSYGELKQRWKGEK